MVDGIKTPSWSSGVSADAMSTTPSVPISSSSVVSKNRVIGNVFVKSAVPLHSALLLKTT